MAKGENGAPARRHGEPTSDTDEGGSKRSSERSKHRSRSKSRSDGKKRRSSSRKSRDDEGEDSDNSCSSKSDSQSESGSYSDSQSGSSDEYSESEDERRRRKRKERKKREEEKKERRRKERKRRRKDREEEEEEEKKKKRKKKKKKDNDSKGKKSAVTNSWGKYGIIRETDMWNKRPEFTAWLGEVKKVNLESLPNWEEKQMFKDFMEDHNTATFPSKKYYNLDAYYRRQMEKEMKKGTKKVRQAERTVFDDEEQRRLELRREREKQKEQEVEALKISMQGGMAQAMKDQALLREEMAYQFKIGNHEAAAAIQRRLDPDVAM